MISRTFEFASPSEKATALEVFRVSNSRIGNENETSVAGQRFQIATLQFPPPPSQIAVAIAAEAKAPPV